MAADGENASLRISLSRSAIGTSRPFGPARFGPYRSCMRPSSFRSYHVVNAKNTITTLITMNAFGIVIHHGSWCITA